MPLTSLRKSLEAVVTNDLEIGCKVLLHRRSLMLDFILNRHLLKILADLPSGALRGISALGVRIPLYAIGRNQT